MAKLIIDIPDDFKNQLIYLAARTGRTLKHQVLDALRKEWDWPTDRMPKDGRYKDLITREDKPPMILTNGQTPGGKIPLDSDGLPDFTPAMERAREAEETLQRKGRPAVHPNDERYKSPDDKPYEDAEPSAIIGDIKDEY